MGLIISANRYSVLGPDTEVIPLNKSQPPIVRNRRLYSSFRQQSMQWLPYLTQLARSPNALKYTGIYPLLPQSIKDYLDQMRAE